MPQWLMTSGAGMDTCFPFAPECALWTPWAPPPPFGSGTHGRRQSLTRFSPGAKDRLTLGHMLLPRKPTPLQTPRVSLG